MFATNLFGAIRVNRAVLPSMRERGAGLLVHVTSTAGRLPAPYLGPYCATKWALEAYAEVLRIELASTGVDSVVVEPGKYSTPIFGKGFPAADDSRAAAYGAADHSKRFFDIFMTEMQALAQDPAEVASAIARLIETPAGQRPFRTLVGRDAEELEPYNAAAEQIRDSVAQKYGLPSGIVPHQRALGAD